MTWFEAYTLRRLLIPMIAIGYATAAIFLKPSTNVELFPFFNWSLFSHTSALKSDAAVLVRTLDGRTIDPPMLYYSMPDTFAGAKGRDPQLLKASQRMVRAFLAGDEVTVEATRRIIEQNAMREAGEVQYDLAIITYDPIERIRSGAIQSVRVLATFEKANQ
jgi:hypothetical protein